jgi:hypothetical protein
MRRERIAVFHGKGRDYLKALQAIRSWREEAELCAIIPANYSLSRDEMQVLDQVLEAEEEDYSPRNWRACLRLVRQIRSGDHDVFIILFNSAQLRILANLSGARQRTWCRVDGRVEVLRGGLLWALADPVLRMLWGRIAYAMIWILIHGLRTGKPNQ